MPTRQTLGEFVQIIIDDEITCVCSFYCTDYPTCDAKKLLCMDAIVAALNGSNELIERKQGRT